MQSFTFFVPFNSSFWNCSYGSVSQLFYLLCIKFIEKKKKTTPLHDDDNKNSIVVTLLLSCLRCIINIHQVLLESASLVPLFKDGELVHMLERHHIEGRPAELIAENLIEAYNTHC